MSQPYLNPHQARDRAPDDYQNLLGDAIERAFAAGIHDLPGLVGRLNEAGVPSPTRPERALADLGYFDLVMPAIFEGRRARRQ